MQFLFLRKEKERSLTQEVQTNVQDISLINQFKNVEGVCIKESDLFWGVFQSAHIFWKWKKKQLSILGKKTGKL